MSQRRWQNIFIDFITELSESQDKNAICIIIDKLTKKRYYVSCTAIDEDTTAEATTAILIQWVFRTHRLSDIITSDRES